RFRRTGDPGRDNRGTVNREIAICGIPKCVRRDPEPVQRSPALSVCKSGSLAAKPIRGRGEIMVKLRYLLPLALVVGLLAVPASASADSAAATISIAGNATFISGSAGPVAVTLHYSCLPPSPG